MKTLGQVTTYQAWVTKQQHFDFTLAAPAAAAAENFPTGNFIYRTMSASRFQRPGAFLACKYEKCRGFSGLSARFSRLLSMPERIPFLFSQSCQRDFTPSKTRRAHSAITRRWNRAESTPDAVVSWKKKKALKLNLNKQSEVLKKIPAALFPNTARRLRGSVSELNCVTASTCVRPLDLDSGTSQRFPQLGASVYKMENQSPQQPNLKTGCSRSHLAGWSALFLDVWLQGRFWAPATSLCNWKASVLPQHERSLAAWLSICEQFWSELATLWGRRWLTARKQKTPGWLRIISTHGTPPDGHLLRAWLEREESVKHHTRHLRGKKRRFAHTVLDKRGALCRQLGALGFYIYLFFKFLLFRQGTHLGSRSHWVHATCLKQRRESGCLSHHSQLPFSVLSSTVSQYLLIKTKSIWACWCCWCDGRDKDGKTAQQQRFLSSYTYIFWSKQTGRQCPSCHGMIQSQKQTPAFR